MSKGRYVYEYPRPMVTVDAVVFLCEEGRRNVLLIQRANDPYKGCWALPGGFVDEHESLEHAVARELEEETGLADVSLTQFHAFGDPGRDPRGHNVCVAYFGEVTPRTAANVCAADDARDFKWFSVESLPALAFDHARIIEYALARVSEV